MLIVLKTPLAILDDAVIYTQIYKACILFMTVFDMIFSILRAFGDSKTPLYFMIISSVANIVLDIVFITTFNMGVAGAALATTLSQIIACIACVIIVN